MSFRQARYDEPVIYEMSRPGRIGYSLPEPGVPIPQLPKGLTRKDPPRLPEVSEVEVVRHYTRLSQMNYGVDSGMYPLGSCTMKYNPKLNEEMSSLEGFASIHPYQHHSTVQGALKLMYELQEMLAEIAGMDAVTLHPAAGAHGEFLGMCLVREYFKDIGDTERTEVIVPDTAHGTNPASAAMAGFTVRELPSDSDGCVDIDMLKEALSEKTAAFMLTNPNTLGVFEKNVIKIARMIHDAGALLYYDGANLNAIMGRVRPGDMGFDIVHFNMHKTLSTPHGGGGPGGGAIGVKEKLAPYLPVPLVSRRDDEYYLDYNRPKSIGKIGSYYGNFGVMVRAYTYLKVMGGNGLREAAELAVLNANYLKKKIMEGGGYTLPFGDLRKHEFVLSGENIKRDTGVATRDLVKRLLDRGLHAPTVYFPLIVHEALMIEPTETEAREELDAYADALKEIYGECREKPDMVKEAPYNTAVGRVDEVLAARKPVLSWRMRHNQDI